MRKVGEKDSENYFAEMTRQEGLLGKLYTVTCGDDTYQGFNPKYPPIFETLYKDKAYEKYKQYASLPSVHERAAELSKILEERDLMSQRTFEAKEQAKLVKENQIYLLNLSKNQLFLFFVQIHIDIVIINYLLLFLVLLFAL